MICVLNLDPMYEGLLRGEELTTDNLHRYNLKDGDIQFLVDKGILEKRNDKYELKKVGGFYKYENKLVGLKQFDKALECLKKIHEINPKYRYATYQLILYYIRNEEYNEAEEYIDDLDSDENKYYHNDYNFLLYLLSLVSTLSKEHQEYVDNLTFDDIKIFEEDKERHRDIEINNDMRKMLFEKDFYKARNIVTSYMRGLDKVSIQDNYLRILFNAIYDKNDIGRRKIKKLVEDKKYQELVESLEYKQSQMDISLSELYTLKLSRVLFEISSTGIIPEPSKKISHNLFDIIENKRYFTALNMTIKYCKEKGYDPNNNTMYLLLNEICSLINKISAKNKKEEKDNDSEVDNTKETIVSLMKENNFDECYELLDKYLEKQGYQKYKAVFIYLIKIGVYKQDDNYTEAYNFLSNIKLVNDKTYVRKYITSFYESLNNNLFEEAELYLNIIRELEIDNKDSIINELENALNRGKDSKKLIKN